MMEKNNSDSSSSSVEKEEGKGEEGDAQVPSRAAAAVAPSGSATAYSSSSSSDLGQKGHLKKKAHGRKGEGGEGKTISQKGASPSVTSTLTADQRWEEMFVRLEAFREQHGHANVPNRYEHDPQLGCWVSTQRRKYKKAKQSKAEPNKLSRQRINRLTQLGFEWEGQNPRHKNWDLRFQALLEFKAKYGHAQVPIGWEEDVQLANWTSTQRQEYKNMLRGKPSRLDDRRIQLLNSVGFAWELQRGGRRRQVSVEAEGVQESTDSDGEDVDVDAAHVENQDSRVKGSKRRSPARRRRATGESGGSTSVVLPGIALIGGDSSSRPSSSRNNTAARAQCSPLPRQIARGALDPPAIAHMSNTTQHQQAPASGDIFSSVAAHLHQPQYGQRPPASLASTSADNTGRQFAASMLLPTLSSNPAAVNQQRHLQTMAWLQLQSQSQPQPHSYQSQQSALALLLQNQVAMIPPEGATTSSRSLLLSGLGGNTSTSRSFTQDSTLQLQQALANPLRLLSNFNLTSGSHSFSGHLTSGSSAVQLHDHARLPPANGQNVGSAYPYRLQQGSLSGTNLGLSSQLLQQLQQLPGRTDDSGAAPSPLNPSLARQSQQSTGGDQGGEAKHPEADRTSQNSSSVDEVRRPRTGPPKKRMRR